MKRNWQDWEPLADRMLVQRTPEPEMTKGGIIIPETVREKARNWDVKNKNICGQSEGTILKAGPGRRIDGEFVPMTLKPGQVVVFGPFSDFDDGDVVIIREADVRLIVAPKETTLSAAIGAVMVNCAAAGLRPAVMLLEDRPPEQKKTNVSTQQRRAQKAAG